MPRHPYYPVLPKLLFGWLTLFVLLIPSAAEARTWTNHDGRTFDGEYLESDQQQVVIRRTLDAKPFRVPLTQLSDDDQKYARAMLRARTAGGLHSDPNLPFVHPGLLHTEEDFQRMRAKVEAGEQPWLDGWRMLQRSSHAQVNWSPRPTETVVRGGEGQNFPVLFNDVHAAYQLAVRWRVSGDDTYADKSIAILNAWSAKLKTVTGNNDRFLAAGIYGYQFANAAEIMRTYPAWQASDFERFQQMMLEVFYPMNHQFLTEHNGAAITNYWANWDLCNIASIQAIGVLCDRRDLYDEAMNYVFHGRGNGAIDKSVYYVHPGNLGQWQEAGRDQGHTTLGIALMGPICETAWHQGEDLYSYDNNRLLAGAEYVAKYNLEHDVPYQPYAWGLGQRGDYREQLHIADDGRGSLRAGFELVMNHYVHRKGISAPYCSQYAAKIRPESGGGGHASTFDQVGFGTLTATLDPSDNTPAPTGLVARRSGNDIVLNWWGAEGANRYTLKRSAAPLGPYVAVATGLDSTLTYTDRNLPPGDYYYVIICRVGDDPPAHSNVAKVSTVTRLVAHFSFDDSESDTSNTPFKLHGGKLVDGKQGQAVSLDGQDDYVELPEGLVSELSDFTIATWVRLETAPTFSRIFDFGDDRGFSLFLTPSNRQGKLCFNTNTVYYYNKQVVEAPEPLPTGRWVHVAVTLTGREAVLYVDGKPVANNPQIDFPPFRLGYTRQNWIGRSQYADPYLPGLVDDFRLYDGALTADQIAELAQQP